MLYVAMTRAKEKLILCGATTDMEKELLHLASIVNRRERELPYYSLTKANTYMDWVLPSLIRNQCFADILGEYEMAVPYRHPMFAEYVPVKVRKVTVDELIWKETDCQYSKQTRSGTMGYGTYLS